MTTNWDQVYKNSEAIQESNRSAEARRRQEQEEAVRKARIQRSSEEADYLVKEFLNRFKNNGLKHGYLIYYGFYGSCFDHEQCLPNFKYRFDKEFTESQIAAYLSIDNYILDGTYYNRDDCISWNRGNNNNKPVCIGVNIRPK